MKGGREAVCGETILPDAGLVGEPKLCAKDWGELVHWSMCSGFMVGLEGLGGRGLGGRHPPWEEMVGEERLVGVVIDSLGVAAASVALD